MGRQETIQIHPMCWEDEPDTQAISLSAFDHLMPRIYVLITLVFALDASVNTSEIIEHLKAGLEITVAQFPALAGTLQTNEKDGSLWVQRKKENTVDMVVNWQNGEEDTELPTYQELAKGGFPAAMLEGDKLLPQAVTAKQLFRGDNDDKDTPVSTFQVNFIRGGLILGIGVHHSVSDGPGCDGFLSQWAENTRAIKNGNRLPRFNPMNLDRSRLNSTATPTATRMQELSEKLPTFRLVKEPPTLPEDFVMPSFSPTMYHFPKQRCERLKNDCKPSNPDAWVSTYDCIMAVLWRATTRAKIPMLEPDMDKKINLTHAVNNRKILNPPLPDRYLGNAVSLAQVTPTATKDVIAEDALPAIALAIRSSISRITPESIQDSAEWVAGIENKSQININVDAFLGMDLAATSWQQMSSYTQQDFGFGVPKAVRFPKPDWEGYVFVYPEREEGVEVCVLLEDACQGRLREDEELGRYASLME
ncbi:hypothetical protein D6D10_09995 [Aureobasidium pullulans]|uniref:Trichothecene 3-O-acetyltransferase n=1 Tax=Aureobasidium pullulans TaxID=5580 RepID=A0A4S9DZE0_AURPU|nr:hypothetical protein D6D10_09995 [Aureobasidium pullulans]